MDFQINRIQFGDRKKNINLKTGKQNKVGKLIRLKMKVIVNGKILMTIQNLKIAGITIKTKRKVYGMKRFKSLKQMSGVVIKIITQKNVNNKNQKKLTGVQKMIKKVNAIMIKRI